VHKVHTSVSLRIPSLFFVASAPLSPLRLGDCGSDAGGNGNGVATDTADTTTALCDALPLTLLLLLLKLLSGTSR
jgi:hypothetical protein